MGLLLVLCPLKPTALALGFSHQTCQTDPDQSVVVRNDLLEEMIMKKNDDSKFMAVNVILAILGIAALVCIVYSMVTDKTYPYLAIGLGLAAFSNIFGCIYRNRKREIEDGSCENRNVS